ncbi:MAG: Malonyl CoA-acyl carrier protein transacylase [Phycisphaerae bacterium]|nr:Malonyl CoA-acyl carrier protein transacylase [Phycisphaerae bacterium]
MDGQKTAYIFPGQGAQIVGMGKDVAEASDHAARVYHVANEILGFDLARLCFEGPAERLESTDIQQPAILVTSLAIWAAMNEGGRRSIPVAATAGLSLGEYVALQVAGALTLEDAIRLIHQRGKFMQEAAVAQPSGMVSIMGLDGAAVERLCTQVAEGQVLQAANFNCPGQIVISGHKEACARAVALIEQGSGKAVPLKVAGAFHSALMKPAAEKLQVELARTPFQPPRWPVLSNVHGQLHTSPDETRELLYRQVFSPVRWQPCVERLIADGVSQFVEVGPGRSLAGMIRKIDRQKNVTNINSLDTLRSYQTVTAGGAP